ncbi:hypothetical protein K440DRAFT_644363 [Wilcoxina mikolae CBS 423.85]|nr:hypothetical protein K440DRAFT_644363 [Wilcoxina mikolae CBS 423.85]
MSPSKKNVLSKISSAVENPGRFFRRKFGRKKKLDKGKQVCRDRLSGEYTSQQLWDPGDFGEEWEEHEKVGLKRGPSKRVHFMETPEEIPNKSMEVTVCSGVEEIPVLEGMSKEPVAPTEVVEQERAAGEPMPEPAAGKPHEPEPEPEPETESTAEGTPKKTEQQELESEPEAESTAEHHEPEPESEARSTAEDALEETKQESVAKIEASGEKEMELQLQAACQVPLPTSTDTDEYEESEANCSSSVQVTEPHVQGRCGLSDMWETKRHEMVGEDPTVMMPCAYPAWLIGVV